MNPVNQRLVSPRWLRAFLVIALGVSSAAAAVQTRISVKFITDASGNVPSNAGPGTNSNWGVTAVALTNAQAVVDNIAYANSILAKYGRGHQFVITEIVNLQGVSQWFNTPARDLVNRTQLEAAALADKTKYAWRDNAMNLYINNTSSGICSIPPLGEIVFIGSGSYNTLILHESLHYLSLYHTHEGERGETFAGDPCPENPLDAPCGCDVIVAGDNDRTGETSPDSECFNSLNAIAVGAYNASFISLDPDRRQRVINSFKNVMSYHNGDGFTNVCDVLTPDQFDRVADAGNGPRAGATSGRTVFVDKNNPCLVPGDLIEPFKTLAGYVTGWAQGTSGGLGVTLSPQNPPPGAPALPCPPDPAPCSITVCLGGPYKTFSDGLGAAGSGDVVVVRAGNYNEPQRITRAVTLCASRGRAVIGKP